MDQRNGCIPAAVGCQWIDIYPSAMNELLRSCRGAEALRQRGIPDLGRHAKTLQADRRDATTNVTACRQSPGYIVSCARRPPSLAGSFSLPWRWPRSDIHVVHAFDIERSVVAPVFALAFKTKITMDERKYQDQRLFVRPSHISR